MIKVPLKSLSENDLQNLIKRGYCQFPSNIKLVEDIKPKYILPMLDMPDDSIKYHHCIKVLDEHIILDYASDDETLHFKMRFIEPSKIKLFNKQKEESILNLKKLH